MEVLTRTVEEIVRRHETLRTRFVTVGGEPQQVIEDQVNVQLPVLDLTGVGGEEEREAEAMRLAREEAQQPFDLKQAPLFRGKLLRLGGLNHVLLFTMHHIISDAWSMGVLIEQVSVLYDAFSGGWPSPLSELPIQYADYTAWQREWLEGGCWSSNSPIGSSNWGEAACCCCPPTGLGQAHGAKTGQPATS